MLSRRVAALWLAMATGAGALAVPHAAGAAQPATHLARAGAAGQSHLSHRPAGLPAGVPEAARLPEPKLPEPPRSAWPFPNAFSRTSGTGRLDDGALLWTDWVYDDHGAAAVAGLPLSADATVSLLAPTQGLASYPTGPAHGNGADIFRAGVGLTARASYWRVDWNTLVNPDVPVAVWVFDTDADRSTGVAAWPAQAGVSSPGIDHALVVSAKSVRLYDLRRGRSVDVLAHGGRLAVDRSSRSFVVRVPRALLKVSGRWRIRLGAGLASAGGRELSPAVYSSGLNAAQAARLPRLYNVTFRTVHQEPPVYRAGTSDAQVAALEALWQNTPVNAALGLDGISRAVTGNFWMEDHQADALAHNNVSAFSRVVDWARLARHVVTREPRPRGYSNRWYVSRLDLGQGVIPNPALVSPGDLRPNYLGRVQPYAVYVPRHVSLHQRLPLTWIEHSLDVNFNQYGALNPHLIQQECQQRQSICATTEGFAPDGWYFDEAEQDFWSVWHALATSYRLDPRRTVMSGYSMGGWASYKLPLEHPDLFSQAMPLEGPPNCGVRIIELNGRQVGFPASAGGSPAPTAAHCGQDGFTAPLLGNAKWVPYVVTQGGIDELVPLPSDIQATNDMRALGLRFTFFLLPANDHLVYALQDRFGSMVHALGGAVPKVKRNPGSIVYRWYPDLDVPKLGIGATTAYWITHLEASTQAAGALASVRARSFGIPERPITVVKHAPQVVSAPLPAVKTRLTWRRGPRPSAADRLVLHTSRVSALRVDASRARLRCPAVNVTADRPLRVTLVRLPSASGARDRSMTMRFPAGHHTGRVAC
ncbi:MAG TPA: peptidase [Mycobacteriales bacterium]|nr:peptidase [Mycobacteriales bacterium]